MKFWESALFLIAQNGDAPQGPPVMNLRDMLPWLLGLFALFYFLVLRPQRRQEQQKKEMLAAVTKGDQVQSIGGIQGVVVGVDEKNDIVVVEVDKNCKLRFVRNAISAVEKKGKKGA